MSFFFSSSSSPKSSSPASSSSSTLSLVLGGVGVAASSLWLGFLLGARHAPHQSKSTSSCCSSSSSLSSNLSSLLNPSSASSSCCSAPASCCSAPAEEPPACCCSSDSDSASSSSSSSSSSSALDWDAQKSRFLASFDGLRDEFLKYISTQYRLTDESVTRVRRLCDETVIGGKYNRALLVTNSVVIISQARSLDVSSVLNDAIVLGWCIEILQAMFLVADDIMDASETRRGKPCWYKLPDIQMDAVNDTLILESWLYFILDRHFASHPRKAELIKLFHDVSLDTEMGQMLDLASQPQGRKGADVLAKFNYTLYLQIVHYKTALYSFYLPLACALLVTSPVNSDCVRALAIAKELAIDLGTKFQIQDDYLDAYGDPAQIGKIGTDLRDHKCTWLLVQALQRADEKQRAVIDANLGSEAGEAAMKSLYNELGIPMLYDKQEEESYASITKKAEANDHILPVAVVKDILNKIHRRQK